MKFFFHFGKWYLKYLILICFSILGFLSLNYIVGCQEVSLTHDPNQYECMEEAVEGVECLGDNMDSPFDGEGPSDLVEPSGSTTGGADPKSSSSTTGGTTGGNPRSSSRSTTGGTTVFRPSIRVTATLGRIDILFVVDNSDSMKPELASISNQFDSFLREIRKNDYHIALTTTDWLSQAGRFMTFSNGRTVLSNPNQNNDVHYTNVRHFQQTLTSLSSSTTDDERGIYVLNQAINIKSNKSFFRPHSLFLAIIVSDEDERSFGGQIPAGQSDPKGLVKPLETYDLPTTFFNKFSEQNKFNIATVHSIIVPPGDTHCASKSGGVEGKIYAQASLPASAVLSTYGNIRRGHIGSICSSNYSSQLGPIAHTLSSVPPLTLPCFPHSGSVSVQVNNRPVNFRVDGRQVIITDSVSFGEEATMLLSCIK